MKKFSNSSDRAKHEQTHKDPVSFYKKFREFLLFSCVLFLISLICSCF